VNRLVPTDKPQDLWQLQGQTLLTGILSARTSRLQSTVLKQLLENLSTQGGVLGIRQRIDQRRGYFIKSSKR
jgi:hypothetical protein